MKLVRSEVHGSERGAMDVRRMFNKVLQSWATDVLALKKRGLDRPSVREGLGEDEPPVAAWTGKRAA